MKTAFSIAWRFLTHSKGQSILIAIGIAVGVSVQVFIGSLISGLQTELVDSAIGRNTQITITSKTRGGQIEDYDAISAAVAKQEPSLKYVTPVADASGFLRVGGEDYPVQVRGFQSEDFGGIYRLDEALVTGSLPAGDQVMLGTTLAEEAKVGEADTVTLATPRGYTKDVTVSGIFDLKVAALNSRWVVSDIALAQSAFGLGDSATSIEMQVEDPFRADTIAESLAPTLPENLKADNWKVQNEQLLSGLSGQSISSLMIQVFVLVSVVLAISSVLAISVLQKSKQLGILKTMGIRDGAASVIFLVEGFILGVAGALLGVAFGVGLGYAFTRFALNPDGTPVIALLIDPQFIALSAGIAVLSSTLASLIPARRSARLDPMEVIRNG
ncbi:MAG: ABC transporter permease [Eubacteriales bacterium]|jgi:lipoprotein-releasing system permease protein|nr:ABC transporter permease [Eubacteriales bacterium]MDD4105352.1 ABC transporter permease [Eubacteriales bacterium]MDD4711256.1 ABC transporter permease [Eubacteriales bacterium]NLO15407.1 ABC transporter permease [Clostridiales bacterium]